MLSSFPALYLLDACNVLQLRQSNVSLSNVPQDLPWLTTTELESVQPLISNGT